MKLIASLVVRNELGRYLRPCLDHLFDFCDGIMVLDDGSDDGTSEYLMKLAASRPLWLASLPESGFYQHEGRIRQLLLHATLGVGPTHVLAIDADELVSDGKALRHTLEANPQTPAFSLSMEEVWKVDEERLWLRVDGGWRVHPKNLVWRVPDTLIGGYRIRDRALACGRVPQRVNALRGTVSGVSLLHFGWMNQGDRKARHARYARHDKGRFHARTHLDSILWPDGRVQLRERPWPQGEAFEELRARLRPQPRPSASP